MSDFEDCMNMAFYVANFRKRIRFVAATDLPLTQRNLLQYTMFYQ